MVLQQFLSDAFIVLGLHPVVIVANFARVKASI